MVGQRIMKEIGATGVPVINVANACATGSTAFREAYYAVASGAYDVAMAVGSEQMGKMGLLGGGGGGDRAYSTEGVMGTGLMPGVFGQAGVEHMRKYGTTQAQIAKIAVKNHEHGVHNPYAQYQKETPLEEVLNARVVSWPNTLYMCCPTGDGAAAAVLMSAEKAKQYTTKPVWVAASVLTSDPYSERNPTMFDINTLTRNAAKEAYEKAGIGPEDLRQVELHDCFATAELLHYENLVPLRRRRSRQADRRQGAPASAAGSPSTPAAACSRRATRWAPPASPTSSRSSGTSARRRQERARWKGAKMGLAHVIGLGSACTINILKK